MTKSTETSCPPLRPPVQIFEDDDSQTLPSATSRTPYASIADQICGLGLQPSSIHGTIRDFLTRQFQPENIRNSELIDYTWRDNESTGILIESVTRRVEGSIGKRPAIMIKRNAYTSFPYAIGDKAGVDKQNNVIYSLMWVGSSTLFCLHKNGLSADYLASEVRASLSHYALQIQTQLRLAKFRVLEVGPVSEIEEEKEDYVVPVTVGWAFEDSWKLTQESPRLRSVELSVLLDQA